MTGGKHGRFCFFMCYQNIYHHHLFNPQKFDIFARDKNIGIMNFSESRLIKRAGWYPISDEYEYYKIDMLVYTPSKIILHAIAEWDDEQQCETATDREVVDYVSYATEGDIPVYPTYQACKDAESAHQSFVEANRKLKKAAAKVKLLALIDPKEDFYEELFKEVIEENFGCEYKPTYMYDQYKAKSRAYDILTSKSIKETFTKVGKCCLALDKISWVSCQDNTLNITMVDGAKYSISKETSPTTYNAIMIIYNL